MGLNDVGVLWVRIWHGQAAGEVASPFLGLQAHQEML